MKTREQVALLENAATRLEQVAIGPLGRSQRDKAFERLLAVRLQLALMQVEFDEGVS